MSAVSFALEIWLTRTCSICQARHNHQTLSLYLELCLLFSCIWILGCTSTEN